MQRLHHGSNKYLVFCVLAAIIGLGVARLASAWYAVSATYDEPEHIAAGLQWWSGEYHRDLVHPPLTRILVSLGPLLRGARFEQGASIEQERRNSLYSTGYEDTLASARAPVAIFFALTCVGTFLWGRWLWGTGAGLAGAGLLSLVPVVLGHSALATTDAGLMAMLTLALYAWARFVEQPTGGRAVTAGVLFGLAAACKLTSFVFFAPAALAMFVFTREKRWRLLPVFAAISILVLWATYGFERSRLDDIGHLHRDHPELRPALETRVPLAKFAWGISHTLRYNKFGHTSYLFGEISRDGWWYFFPVVLAVKTPLPFLLLAIAGVWLTWKQGWARSAPAWIALLMLAICLPMRINLGARHILPLYPMLAMLGGVALSEMWRRSWALAALPVLWLGINSVQAQPAYFDWFNELAGSHPERILGESDLDWGQDLARLRDVLVVEDAKELWLAYFGSANLEEHGLPMLHRIDAAAPPPPGSWVAVSLHELLWNPERYRWLEGSEYRMVGRSIRLYRMGTSS